jgi:hypothetical protein
MRLRFGGAGRRADGDRVAQPEGGLTTATPQIVTCAEQPYATVSAAIRMTEIPAMSAPW